MTRALIPIQLGRMNYHRAYKIQEQYKRRHLDQLAGRCKVNAENVVLLVEHAPVYTIGIRTQGYTIRDEEKLSALGAEFYRTNRGGLITFHGPGQLVAYPVLNLKHFKIGMREYICALEQSVMSVCRGLGLQANTSPHTGVWIGDSKVAAIGVHGSRYITTHGLGINCDIDLGWFEHIVPCGIEDKGVTSLSRELNRGVTVHEIQGLLLRAMGETFQCDVTEVKDYST